VDFLASLWLKAAPIEVGHIRERLALREMRHVDLGVRDYAETLELQRQMVERRRAGEIVDTLLTVEHPEVITLGRRREARQNILDAGGVPVVEVERGGDVTWHGPGQLVGYPIFELGEGERDVHGVLRRLEDVVIGVLRGFGMRGERRAQHTGVWVESQGRLLKIASLGVAIQGWVTFHGFALNVDCELSRFALINPCGLESGVMTSLAGLGVVVPERTVMARLAASHVAEVFGRTIR
jgi:lipoate-protein ligase B